jgi:hypothetical protein
MIKKRLDELLVGDVILFESYWSEPRFFRGEFHNMFM